MLLCSRGHAARTISKGPRLPATAVYNRTAASVSTAFPLQQEHEVFTLANGNKIGYSTYGPLKAPALFFFHGQGGSRLQGFAKRANRIALRIICPDRPGIGLSTFEPYRELLDYPPQIAQLANHLGLKLTA